MLDYDLPLHYKSELIVIIPTHHNLVGQHYEITVSNHNLYRINSITTIIRRLGIFRHAARWKPFDRLYEGTCAGMFSTVHPGAATNVGQRGATGTRMEGERMEAIIG